MNDEEERGTRCPDRTATTAAQSRNRGSNSPEQEQSDSHRTDRAVVAPAPVIADRYGAHSGDPQPEEGSTARLLTCGAPDPDSASGQVRARLEEAQFLQALADLNGDFCQARWARAAVASITARLQALATDPSQEMSAS